MTVHLGAEILASAKMTPHLAAQILMESGYRCISRKFNTVARVDRSLAHERGAARNPDWHRRCVSKDKLDVGSYVGRRMKSSCHDPIERPGDHPRLAEAVEYCGWDLQIYHYLVDLYYNYKDRNTIFRIKHDMDAGVYTREEARELLLIQYGKPEMALTIVQEKS